MKLEDKVTVNSVRTTKDGYLVAEAPVARTGIQYYRGTELNKPDMEIVRVYRPEEEVFHKDSLKTYAHRPITLGHPPDGVNSGNWKEEAIGQTGDDVLRDGGTVRVPLVIMDKDAVSVIEKGHRQLSMGYDADIIWEAGETSDGLAYDAVSRNLRMNHLAIVAEARGGSGLKIGDDRSRAMADKTVMVDGIEITLPDTSAQYVQKFVDKTTKDISALNAQLEDSGKKLAAAEKERDEAKGKIEALEKQIADQAITPEKLEALATERASIVAVATKMGVTDGLDKMTNDEIRRAVVTVQIGDRAKDFSSDTIHGAFEALAATAKIEVDPVRQVIRNGVTDSRKNPWGDNVYSAAGIRMKKGA